MGKNKLVKIIVLILIIILGPILALKLYVHNNINKYQIPVLMYHQVVYDEYYKGQSDAIKLSTFEKQLQYFKENNIEPITLDEFYCWKKGKCSMSGKKVVLTFDDGFYSFHYLVEPLLEKYGYHATCFVIGKVTEETTAAYNPEKYGTIGIDLIKKSSKYVDYQSHSYDMHMTVDGKQKIYTMSKKEMQKDLDDMKKIKDFKYMSYPFNTDVDIFIDLLKDNNYKLSFRGESEKATKNNNDFQIPRIGVHEEFDTFKKIFETKYYNNRYGSGIIRKVLITLERKLGSRLF